MTMVTPPYTPNNSQLQPAPDSTAWQVVASDGTTYTTIALLLAAGKKFYKKSGTCFLYGRSDADGSDGSNFYIAFNATTGTDLLGQLVDGVGGQQLLTTGSFNNLWLKTNGSDTIDLLLKW